VVVVVVTISDSIHNEEEDAFGTTALAGGMVVAEEVTVAGTVTVGLISNTDAAVAAVVAE
jgi:hypothetical protein